MINRIKSKKLSQAAVKNWLSGNETALQGLAINHIDNLSWKEYPYKPSASFYIGNNTETIFLHFVVKEEERRVTVTEINGPVWEDSCVEFFVSFDDLGYYNMEFNAAGVALVGFGKNRNERVLLEKETIKKIKTVPFFREEASINNVQWELAITIPIQVFVHHTIIRLNDLACRANFYKCGDKLQRPHFLSWSSIKNPEPNFHLPGFFGELYFE